MHGFGTAILDALRDESASAQLRRAADRLGLPVDRAPDGARLLNILRAPDAPAYSAVFTALKYEETDVFEVLRLVRTRTDGARIPVYLAVPEHAASGHDRFAPADPDYLHMATLQGVGAVLTTPFDETHLRALLAPGESRAAPRSLRRAR